MPEQQQQQITVENPIHALMNVMIDFDEEAFRFLMMSGGPARMYSLSPKHAKRILMLLQNQIAAYEKKFSKIETQLAKVSNTATDDEVGFHVKGEPKK